MAPRGSCFYARRVRIAHRAALAAVVVLACQSLTQRASAQRSNTGWAVNVLGARAVEPLAGVHASNVYGALVELPEGADLDLLGVHEIVPGIGVLRGDASKIAGFVAAHPTFPIELAPPLRTRLDLETPYVAAERARLGGSLDGAGTYVGIVDTGLDIFHPDFRGADGRTRVAWLLDLSMPARADSVLDKKYGARVFRRDELDVLLGGSPKSADVPNDDQGHGTHVAGIAAGNGGPSKRYVGVAPGADLVIVRATRDKSGNLDEADAVLGAAFVFDMAKADKRPAVVNLSIGTQFGPHDGTSTFERALSELAIGPGRAVIAAASNEGDLPIHTALRVSTGGKAKLPVMLAGSDGHGAAYGPSQVFVWLDWRDGGDVRVSLEGPDGHTWVGPIGLGENDQRGIGGDVKAVIVNDVPGEGLIPRGTHGAVVTWQGSFPAGQYHLVLEGDGAVEAWLQGTGDAGQGDGQPIFPQGGLIEGSIGLPASAEGIISVGCVGVRETLTSRTLKTFTLQDVPRGTRCFFSSAGPSANGAMRPDFLAPGYFVVSALASRAFDASPNGDFGADQIVDPEHAALSGTSMSSPFGAGAVALLFERDPTMTQEDARSALLAGARPLADDAAGMGFRDYAKGAGILDVAGAITALDRKGVSPSATSLQVRLGGSYLASDGQLPLAVLVHARDADGRPADVSGGLQLEVDGAVIASQLTRPATGLYRFSIAASPAGGRRTATIRLLGAVGASREIPIGADRWDARFGLTASGGCDYGAGSARSEGGAALALVAASALMARSRTSRARSHARGRADRRGATAARAPRR